MRQRRAVPSARPGSGSEPVSSGRPQVPHEEDEGEPQAVPDDPGDVIHFFLPVVVLETLKGGSVACDLRASMVARKIEMYVHSSV